MAGFLLCVILFYQAGFGKSTAEKLVSLSNSALCLYPYEMREAAKVLKAGGSLEQIEKMIVEGTLEDYKKLPTLEDVRKSVTESQGKGENSYGRTSHELSVHPQILDLYTVLEQNGLSKQKEEIQSLVSYIENMENKLSEMSEEIENMHKALERMNDRKFRNKCQNIISSIEEKIQQARTMISVTKVKLVNFADNAVKTFSRKRTFNTVTDDECPKSS